MRCLPQSLCLLLNFAFKISNHSFLKSFRSNCSVEKPSVSSDHTTGFVNARGAVPVVRLHDIPNHVREVALHGVRHGAIVALAATQARSGHNLRLLPHGFLATERPRDHDRLVDDFFNAANSVAFNTQADDIVSKVFSGP